jgi:GR25 family glycosyltransferase involved in LPS biosynthesis
VNNFRKQVGADSIYVVSLARLTKRRERVKLLEEQLDCGINIVEAYDHVDYENDLDFIDKHLSDKFFDPAGYITLGVLCCALSHRKAWKHFLDSKEEVGLFLEDDVFITDNIKKYNFEEIRAELDNLDWGICWYGKYADDIATSRMLTSNIAEPVPHFPQQYAAHSYLLTRQSAKWLYKNTSKIKYAADVQLEIMPFNQVCLTKSIFKQFKNEDRVPTLSEELTISNTFSEWDEVTSSIVRIPENFIKMKYYPKKVIHNTSIVNGWQFEKIR